MEVLPTDKLIHVLTKLLNTSLQTLEEEDLLEMLATGDYKKEPLEDILQSEDMAGA